MASATKAITDPDEILRWAEERGARPARVKGTGGKGDPGMIRLDFPGFSGEGSLEPIPWSEWFRAFDENNLGLLVQETTSRGQKSNFNKLVSRETVRAGRRKQAGAERSRRQAGAAPSRKQTGAARSRKQSAKRQTSRKQAGRTRSASSRSAARKASTGGRKAAGSRTATRSRRTSTRRSTRARAVAAKKTARRRAT